MYSYNKNKRKLNYMILIIMILTISIGYAILSTNLNIVGSSQISAPTWDIHWENVSVKTGSVTATTPTIDTNKTTVNYSVTLSIPGEYYEFTVDAVNVGTLDGMISVVSNKLNGTEITTLPSYLEYKVTYEDGVDIAPNHLLAANSSEKYKVHVGYKKDISVSDIPATAQTLNLSFSVTYVQSDSNVIPNPHSKTVYTVNMFDSNNQENTVVKIGQSIPNAITQYSTPQAAMTVFNNRPFCLKHLVENNKVEESYIEFVVTQEMSNNNPGMTAGTYELIGGFAINDNETFEHDLNIMYEVFDYEHYPSRCYDDASGSHCVVSGLHVDVYHLGIFAADSENNGGIRKCTIYYNGNSYCEISNY